MASFYFLHSTSLAQSGSSVGLCDLQDGKDLALHSFIPSPQKESTRWGQLGLHYRDSPSDSLHQQVVLYENFVGTVCLCKSRVDSYLGWRAT